MDVTHHFIGYPRIGPNRELKWVLERAWSGRIGHPQLDEQITELRASHLNEQRELIGSAVDDFFLYDQVLETALMFGLVPGGLATQLPQDPFAVMTALARGTPDREAWEMTKWFDTNYHYVVPEITGAVGPFTPLPWRRPTFDADVTWTVLGPYSLVKLSRLGTDNGSALGTSRAVGDALWQWVKAQASEHPGFRLQIDEPCLGLAMTTDDRAVADAAYGGAADLGLDPAPIVTVQFGRASEGILEALGQRRLSVQVPLSAVAELSATPAWDAQPEHVIAVVDGRSVWPDAFEPVAQALDQLQCGEVKDEVRPFHQTTQERQVGHAPLDNLDPRFRGRLTKVLSRPADEIVQDDDAGRGRLGQLVDDMGSKKAGTANDQDFSVVELMQGCP